MHTPLPLFPSSCFFISMSLPDTVADEVLAVHQVLPPLCRGPQTVWGKKAVVLHFIQGWEFALSLCCSFALVHLYKKSNKSQYLSSLLTKWAVWNALYERAICKVLKRGLCFFMKRKLNTGSKYLYHLFCFAFIKNKREQITLYKKSERAICSSLSKTNDSHEKTKSWFPTLILYNITYMF